MQYVSLGRSGLQVSRLILGTMNFGPHAAEEESFGIMDAARERGINMFDTANIYGWAPNQGWTEEIIGRWLRSRPGARDQLVIATKLHNPMGDGPNDRGLSARAIRREVDASLRRLQVDHIDLLQFHAVDPRTGWDEIWQAIETLVWQGKIIYTGSSNFAGWNIAQANEVASRHNGLGLISEQATYSLLNRGIEAEVIPAARAYGLGVIAWSPLASGLLSGALKRQGDEGRATLSYNRSRLDAYRPQLERFEALADEMGASAAALGLAWVLSRPAITGALIGPRTVEQLETSLPGLEVSVDATIAGRLDEIAPGPGGLSPAIYRLPRFESGAPSMIATRARSDS
jgi:aryl-alcohol dehydrogenase-like predicted oxidoreductase